MFDLDALRERQRQWDLFHEWEQEERPVHENLTEAWHWYEETWELAHRTGAIPAQPSLDMEKISYLMQIQETLARLPWPR